MGYERKWEECREARQRYLGCVKKRKWKECRDAEKRYLGCGVCRRKNGRNVGMQGRGMWGVMGRREVFRV